MKYQRRRVGVPKVVSLKSMNIMFLATLLCSCSGGGVDQPAATELAAAKPTAEVGLSSTGDVLTSSTDQFAIVIDKPVVDEDKALSIKEVVEIAIAAIDNPNTQPSTTQASLSEGPDLQNPYLPTNESDGSDPVDGTDDAGPIGHTDNSDQIDRIDNSDQVELTDNSDPDVDSSPTDEHPDEATQSNIPSTSPPSEVSDTQLGSIPVIDSSKSADSGKDEQVTFGGFRQNGLPDRFRPLFGCGGTVEDHWLTIPSSWPRTWSVNSRNEFDAAVANMDDGDRIYIEPGTDLGSVELTSSGSPNAKKYIVGGSHCGDTSGPDSFSTRTRFKISGNDWVIMNLKFYPSGSTRAIHITGARNWVYNNRIDRAGEVLLTTEGTTVDEPATVGNRVIGNYFNGANDSAGVRMINPFGVKNGQSVVDLVIGGNTFEDFQEPSFGPKVITDTTFGWNYPYGSDTDLPGTNTFTELGWNHFIDCHGEVPTSKTRRWMIHNNLYETTPAYKGTDTPHISLRGGDDKLVFRNIFLDGNRRVAQKSMEIAGKRSHGYFNVSYRNDNTGIGLYWTTTETDSSFAFPDKTWYLYERIEDIDWRYNFFLGDGGDTAAWSRVAVLGRSVVHLPPVNNSIRENFVSAENPTSIKFNFTDYGNKGLSDIDWVNNNPDATSELQYYARRVGDVSYLDSDVTIPKRVKIDNFWLDGQDINIDLPPWIDVGGNGLIDLIE